MTLDEFFTGFEQSRTIFDVLHLTVNEMGPVELRVTRSQIAFVQGNPFAWAWIPGRYLRGKIAPLVLSLVFHHKDYSPRWKQVVEPSPGKFIHHLELFSTVDIDHQVQGWLLQARTSGRKPDSSEVR